MQSGIQPLILYIEHTEGRRPKSIPCDCDLLPMEWNIGLFLAEQKEQKNKTYLQQYDECGRVLLDRIVSFYRVLDKMPHHTSERLLKSAERILEQLKNLDQALYQATIEPRYTEIIAGGWREEDSEEKPRSQGKDTTNDKAKASTITTATPKPAPSVDPQLRIISGVQGLADYLGCCKTTAQSIISSRILPGNVQYMVRACWKFNREKLDLFIASNPTILGERQKNG